jgi:hypothetical protein
MRVRRERIPQFLGVRCCTGIVNLLSMHRAR